MWFRRRIDLLGTAIAAAALLAACGSVPPVPDTVPSPREERVESVPSAPDQSARAAAQAPADPSAAVSVIEVSPRAATDFARAVSLMQAGDASEAELEFQQLALAYPQLAGPHANLGILHRKAGRLEAAIASLRAAVERNPAHAVAWNELGVVLRMHGRFAEASRAYEAAIAADPNLAAAHRNLGVLKDLYLGDPDGALSALERYRALTGEDKPVTGWIAELRHRTGAATPTAPAVDASQPAALPSEGA